VIFAAVKVADVCPMRHTWSVAVLEHPDSNQNDEHRGDSHRLIHQFLALTRMPGDTATGRWGIVCGLGETLHCMRLLVLRAILRRSVATSCVSMTPI
jgi:hypothetical protein